MSSRERTGDSVGEDVLVRGARKLGDDPGRVEGVHALALVGTPAALCCRVLGLVGRHSTGDAAVLCGQARGWRDDAVVFRGQRPSLARGRRVSPSSVLFKACRKQSEGREEPMERTDAPKGESGRDPSTAREGGAIRG
jgi:hypothetical protein